MVSKRQSVAIVGVVLLVAMGVGFAAMASGPSPEVAAQQTAQATCDFESLYDRTNNAVVSVRSGGLGSGFVYGTTGGGETHVVTNAHVVGDASTVRVQFSGEETREGTVVGRDRLTDLAVVRVPQTPGYVGQLDIANETPEHGQSVAALGNPFGLEETITHGIVSGLNRSMPTQFGFSIPDTVQTDAPISPGNSGGPLVTCDGEVVGVNSAGIAARGAENIGFAVSGTIVQAVVPELIETGSFAHPYLGVQVEPVDPATASANSLADPDGLIITAVQRGTPAAEVLQAADDAAVVSGQRVPVGGDVILAVDGTAIDSQEGLSSTLLTRIEPGEEVPVTIVRDGQQTTVTVTLVERPEPATAGSGSEPDGAGPAQP